MAKSNLHRLIGNAKKKETVPPEQSFLADLNRTIVKMDEEKARKPSKSYKPSSLSCIRNIYYQRIGHPQDPGGGRTAELVGITQTGSDRHDHIQNAVNRMKEFDIDCEYYDVAEYIEEHGLDHLEVIKKQGMETKLWHKHLNMSFLCDGIIKYKGVFYVLEIKTETVRKWYGREETDEKHHPQATAYSLSFNIHKVMFLYENRDVCGKKCFMFEVKPTMVDEVVDKIETCEGYVTRLTVPPKPENADRKLCQYCNYKASCKKDGK